MNDGCLRIEASQEDLLELRAMLYQAVDDVDLTEDTEIKSGTHSEPIVVALVVALGGATLTTEVFKTVRRWMEHRERMAMIQKFGEGDAAQVMGAREIEEAAA